MLDFITEEGRIFATNDEGSTVAEITFYKTGNTYCIDHTLVDDSLRGQGVAGKLVELAVEYIQGKGYGVTATCSYAANWLRKNG